MHCNEVLSFRRAALLLATSIVLFFLNGFLAHASVDADPKLRAAAESDGLMNDQAVPLMRVAPDYPKEAAWRRLEGWVEVRFNIDELGTVSDILVLASTSRVFNQPTLDAVERWQYKPAIRDGKAGKVFGRATRLTFEFEPLDTTYKKSNIRPFNSSKFGAFDSALRKGKLERANALLADISSTAALNVYEVSVLDYGRYQLAMARNHKEKAWIAISRAVGVENLWENEAAFSTLLRLRLRLALELNRYADVLRIAEDIERVGGRRALRKVDRLLEEAHSIVSSGGPVTLKGVIDKDCNCGAGQPFWSYRPTRRNLELRDMTSKVKRLEIYCENDRHISKARADWHFQIPEEWGTCTVRIFGDQGASFELVEY